jgi:replication-associated recombination protein RarA
MSKRYLGLHGPAGVGKSTIGDLLVSLSGGEWEVFSFAKKLKQTCSAVFELSYEMFEDQDLKNKPLVPIPIDLYINKIEQVLNLQGMPNLSLIAHTPRQILGL